MTDPQPRQRLRLTLAHKAPSTYVAIAVIIAVNSWVDDMLSVFISLACTVTYMFLMLCSIQHRTSLCGICASMTPLDGVTEADRHDNDLRLYHRPLVIIYALVGVVVAMFGALIAGLPPWTTSLSSAAMYIVVSFQVRSWNRHAVLAPWCSYCPGGWGGGGRWEPSPDPYPTPTSERQL